MQKKILILLFIFELTISFFQPTYAQMDMMGLDSDKESQEELDTHGEPIDEVLENVLDSHSASTITELNCDQVTDDEFEHLGEASMSLMHPNPNIHERMDQMMGGEGSETLRQAHINMGQAYLNCSGNSSNNQLKNGIGMMSTGRKGTWNIMNSGLFSFHWLIFASAGILLNVLLVVLIRYFWKKGSGKK
jgi:hypothetical protein